MSGVKHAIESSFVYISKPLHLMKMKIAMEKLKEMLTEKDQDEMENENDMKMKHGEMKLSKFGFGFELTGFVAFLSWTGMCLFSLLGVVSVLLIALPMEPYFQKAFSRDEWNEFEHVHVQLDEWVSVLMQVLGSVFLVIAVGYFIMNFLLRKKNRDNNFQGVKKMLTVICSIRAVLGILVVSVPLILDMYNMMNGIFMPTQFSAIVFIPALVFCCLLLLGIRKERSGFVKAFLIFQYTIFGLITACIAICSVGSAVGYGMFIIFPSFLLLIMINTFFFVFNIGFYVALHSIYLENEKTQQQKKKNIEFINASFENC